MIKIRIPHTQAHDAILWASEHFGDAGYIVHNTFPDNKYEFRFQYADQASLFALKWM